MGNWPVGKTCFCNTCGRAFHYLGIARHRAMHREKKEECSIEYTNGNTFEHDYSVEDPQ